LALNHQLTSRGATLVEKIRTAPRYRLYLLPNTSPPKPGLLRVGAGQAIDVEVWRVPNAQVAAFLADVPPPLAIGSLELESGAWVKGFVAEPCAFEDAEDITVYGGFRAFLEARG
jgi:allophanate hydrolase